MKTNCETEVYIDWFYLCHMSIHKFLSDCVYLVLAYNTHLARTLPVEYSASVPKCVDDLLNPTCAELLHYINSEPLDDVDFLHDMHITCSLHMEIDRKLLSGLLDKHKGCKVYILCPIRDSALQLLSVSYLSQCDIPKVTVAELGVREFLRNKANDKKVILYTKANTYTFLPESL